MKISIITATYNSEKNISECIKSVNDQTYNDIEHIIIDGKSEDKTLEIIKQLPSRVACIVSENDNGIYEALNKGIFHAKGDIIGFLHSDDVFFDKDVLEDVVNTLKNENCDYIYGNGIYIDDNENTKRVWVSGQYNLNRLRKGWMPLHPTIFCKNKIYDYFGKFDETLKISSDYDFVLRLFSSNIFSSFYLDRMIVKMKVGGISTNYKNLLLKFKEDLYVMRQNGLNPFLALPFKILSKLGQFL